MLIRNYNFVLKNYNITMMMMIHTMIMYVCDTCNSEHNINLKFNSRFHEGLLNQAVTAKIHVNILMFSGIMLSH